MTEIKLGRRTFLLNAAASALMMPILNMYENSGSVALGAGTKRALFVSSFDGIYHGDFWPGVRADQAGWELGQLKADFMGASKIKNLSEVGELPRILQPFNSIRNKLVLVHGLQNPNIHGEDDHLAGTKGIFTGGGYPKGNNASGPSIDWHLKTQLALSHMGIGVQINGGSNTFVPYFNSNGLMQSMTDRPEAVFASLFPSGNAPNSGGGSAPVQARTDFLDIAAANLNEMMPRFSLNSKRRLQENMDAISDLRKKLTVVSGGPVANTCSLPSKTYGNNKYPGYIQENGRSDFDSVSADFMADMIIASFKCNLRNVMNLSLCASVSEIVYRHLGITKSHHTVSHKGNNAGDVAVNWQDSYVKISQYHASIIAKIALALEATAEAGGTMLDSTIIHWDNENSFGDPHHHFPQPSLIVGGKSLGLKQGIMASYYRQNEDIQSWVASSDYNKAQTLRNGHPDHAKLLNSICKAFGTTAIKAGAGELTEIHV